jgi:hypothetical protein
MPTEGMHETLDFANLKVLKRHFVILDPVMARVSQVNLSDFTLANFIFRSQSPAGRRSDGDCAGEPNEFDFGIPPHLPVHEWPELLRN